MYMDLELPCRPDGIDAFLAQPTPGAVESLRRLHGDMIIIGAGGKMGPTLCLMASEALRKAGSSSRVKAVSRFSNAKVRQALEAAGVETIVCDLTDRKAVASLPEAPNVIFLAGMKFGTADATEMTWVMNTVVPSYVGERYRGSRIVVFSTGCVYSFSSVFGGGSTENDPTQPMGDYANSCVGRERVFSYYSKQYGTPVTLFRLNYSIDFRYGVLLDVAMKVASNEPVDVTTGSVNVIWQGDACARALQCLEIADAPAVPINITGPETISIRSLALRFGELFGTTPLITGKEHEHLWLSNASKSFGLFGYPTVSLDQMVKWCAAWVQSGGEIFEKPTQFEVRSGVF
ncbi:MAG: NAD(P)-dependent oxidoreductase [Verrucomicrobiota bacterium]